MSVSVSIPSPTSSTGGCSSGGPPATPLSPTGSPTSSPPNVAVNSSSPNSSNNTNAKNSGNANNNTNGSNNHSDGSMKRKASRRANTAERRATHNAVERQRRETLNGRFLDLAALLPNLATVRRPSKSAIVNSSIALIHSHRRVRAMAGRELRVLEEEATALRREVNEWRSRTSSLPLLQTPARSQDFIALVHAAVGGGEDDDEKAMEEERKAYLLAGNAEEEEEEEWDGGPGGVVGVGMGHAAQAAHGPPQPMMGMSMGGMGGMGISMGNGSVNMGIGMGNMGINNNNAATTVVAPQGLGLGGQQAHSVGRIHQDDKMQQWNALQYALHHQQQQQQAQSIQAHAQQLGLMTGMGMNVGHINGGGVNAMSVGINGIGGMVQRTIPSSHHSQSHDYRVPLYTGNGASNNSNGNSDHNSNNGGVVHTSSNMNSAQSIFAFNAGHGGSASASPSIPAPNTGSSASSGGGSHHSSTGSISAVAAASSAGAGHGHGHVHAHGHGQAPLFSTGFASGGYGGQQQQHHTISHGGNNNNTLHSQQNRQGVNGSNGAGPQHFSAGASRDSFDFYGHAASIPMAIRSGMNMSIGAGMGGGMTGMGDFDMGMGGMSATPPATTSSFDEGSPVSV